MEGLRDRDPARIGAYTLLARLGAGGMGQVYLGRSPGGRLVAIKVIRDEITDHPEALARFRREVETAGAVRSAYTANLIDASLDAAPYWLATEYVSGPTLGGAVAARGPLPPETCRGLFAALAEGLAAVHHGVTHRDLKPQNVILAAQGPQLIDFGIARAAGQTALTEAGFAPGTPGFTAPEVLLRNEVGPAADVFALGATLAYAVTGRPPFGVGEPAGVSYRAVHEAVDLGGVEPGLAALVEACVVKDPAARPSLAEVIARCGVRAALVEDTFYAGLAGLGEAVPQTPPPRQVPATPDASAVPPVPAAPPVGTHDLPTASAPHGYGYTPTQTAQPAPAARGRTAPWMVAVAVGLVVGVGAATAFVLMPKEKDGDSAAKGGKSPAPTSSTSSSAAAKGAPAYAGDKLDRSLWSSATGACNLPSEERAGDGFMMSLSDPDQPENTSPTITFDNKVKIGIRDKYASAGRKPYYVTVSVKSPHDIDPTTGKPVEGLLTDNRAVGYTSKPVDLYGGSDPLDWKWVTYPDDFRTWVKGKPHPSIPLANDPGDWTVEFHHIRTPEDYTSIMCDGFTAK
ncbi:serine/threonine-protein kinase [Streptomyces avermitilis]|uniref:serine/threonine-protein kinase n=1 Tax=Streptomyces avermitilis TaxID=33903 RepID=UPI0033DB5ADD